MIEDEPAPRIGTGLHRRSEAAEASISVRFAQVPVLGRADLLPGGAPAAFVEVLRNRLSAPVVVWRHAFRNALIPVITGGLFSSSDLVFSVAAVIPR